MPAPAQTQDDRAHLVGLLRTAAQVEHSLMLSYLYAAFSLRSTPQEFQALPDGQPNQRRAVQFERARDWKLKILRVAVEEMLHLHYVQCLLRALGEPPCFDLPQRDADGWIIPAWRPDDSFDAGTAQSIGAHISLGPATTHRLASFILFESTDSLQHNDIDGPRIVNMFKDLFNAESDLHFESILLNVADDNRRQTLKAKLAALYNPEQIGATLGPTPAPDQPHTAPQTFQSVGDLYTKGIEPLYKQAFQQGWVGYSNVMLNNELFDPECAGSVGGRLVPIGPVTRNQRFARLIMKGADDPLRNFKNVDEIIQVILGEGEGFTGFESRATALLEMWQANGTRPYAQGLVQAVVSGGMSTPGWMAEWELVRQSHLYRFAMVYLGISSEAVWSGQASFDPCREPVVIDSVPALQQIARDLPAQQNACYLVLTSWMSRIYETPDFVVEKPRRDAIEMLASWPLMSLAMRPLLELCSFFPLICGQLFRPEEAAVSSPEAQQLTALSRKPDHSAQDEVQMDESAVAMLARIAAWAAAQIDPVNGAPIREDVRRMMVTRLRMLSRLDEFQKQFAYRVAGGYSDRMPSLEYQQQFKDSARFEEDPFQHKPASQKPQDTPAKEFPLFSDTLVLRLRFSGWALAQLATDPDPSTDEVGCMGAAMFHAADGDRRLDASIVWQDSGAGHIIRRGPRDKLPPIGVNCKEISLLVADGAAEVGYVPFPTLQLPGALQSAPVQEQLEVQNLLHLLTLQPEDILGTGRNLHVDLREKNGVKPFYNGLNHLVWQDGEPIDPFVFAVTADPPQPTAANGAGTPPTGSSQPSLVLHREVYNEGLSLLQMTPLQRLLTSRGPCGLQVGAASIPDWALTPAERQALTGSGFPTSYLTQRAGALVDSLSATLDCGGDTREHTDEVVSLAERLAQVTTPMGTTKGWLTFVLHYGHSLSGDLAFGEGLFEVLSAFGAKTGLELSVSYNGARYASNSRWLVKYALGIMDVDALSNLVYGELYVPLTLQVSGPVNLTGHWSFCAAMLDAVAAFACRFEKPFWAAYQVDGNSRTLCAAGGPVVETMQPSPTPTSYSYSLSGLQCVTAFQGKFEAASAGTGTSLTWTVSATCADSAGALKAVAFVAAAAKEMKNALAKYFAPEV
jgi:hypothetical protein